ncbi:flavin reductase family protein [Croceicoccus bisphenolivorans]|uniref:flavin reductase family protein n=1 Tax=Croceicoccus bisphenolivorans TaxID=1783232 RepID=UPI000A7E49B4|nr:flavin reductase family protein [Croceicoccus bisphenolivorans]
MMIEASDFRKVLGAFPTGVCVVTSTDPLGGNHGMVVGSFTSISLDPPLVGFFPARESRTWQAMRDNSNFCINILGAGADEHCRRFTARSGEKFAGLEFASSRNGQPRLRDALAWIDIAADRVIEIGDHDLLVGRVTALAAAEEGEPMVFFRGRYRALAEPEAVRALQSPPHIYQNK